LLFACKKNDTSVRDVIKFTKDWKFVLDDQSEFKVRNNNL